MHKNITIQKKDYLLLQEKYKKINIVNDQISGWAKRVYSKFGALTDSGDMANQDDIIKVFQFMDECTSKEL
jgi:hypothetical protein